VAYTLEELTAKIKKEPNNSELYVLRAELLYEAEKYEEALADCDTAISLKSNVANTYRIRGQVCWKLKRHKEAIANCNKAIKLKSNFAEAYNYRGYMYGSLERYDEALADYTQAIKLNPDFVNAYINRADLFDKLDKKEQATQDRATADKLSTAQRNYGQKSLYAEQTETENTGKKPLPENEKLKQLMELIEKKGIEAQIYANNEEHKAFFRKGSNDKSPEHGFWVLRRWNSYTPILSCGENTGKRAEYSGKSKISKGGGYFFKTEDCGIVIDPGFNFINNFEANGFLFQDIDHVLITHAHNDHTADLESLLTLLHKYNEFVLGDIDVANDAMARPKEVSIGRRNIGDATDVGSNERDTQTMMWSAIKKWANDNPLKYKANTSEDDKNADTTKYTLHEAIRKNDDIRAEITRIAEKELKDNPRRKRIALYMTASTHKKYAAMLDLKRKSHYDLKIINAGDVIELKDPNGRNNDSYAKDIYIKAIRAKHDDIQSDRDSVGFVIEDKSKKFVIVYTGDTGYNKEIDNEYRNLRKDLENKKVFLLAHLGGFKRYETPIYGQTLKENERYFYKNHLGRLGMAKLIEALQPNLCAISEFGEEFSKQLRIELTKMFGDVYNDTVFLAACIGLCVNTDGNVRAITKLDEDNQRVEQYTFISPKNVLMHERQADSSLHYYDKEQLKEACVQQVLYQQFLKEVLSIANLN
jgi:ribonuclease BN (tRNA processing enzyme)